MSDSTEAAFRCGTIALAGRPNVGKSTLMNRLIGEKISITSHKPQTTRHAVLGIYTEGRDQFIYVDTPGMHSKQPKNLNRVLNRTANSSVRDVDVAVLLVVAGQWFEDDERALSQVLASGSVPVLVVNKVDQIKRKEALLPYLQSLPRVNEFQAVIPLSAKNGKGVEILQRELAQHLPEAPHVYESEQITDRSMRFIAAEFVREQLTRQLDQELPYAISVEVESFVEEPDMVRIAIAIWVERDAQKAIVIGKRGGQLKTVGARARESLEKLFGCKVYLQLWVKVRKDWSDDLKALQSLGYDSEA